MASDSAAELVASWGPAPATGKASWLRARLIDAVLGGRLLPGTVLPGARDLAHAVGVARGTADTVYAQLVDEGFIDSRPRRRPVVAGGPGRDAPALAPPVSAAPPPTPGVPDSALFPHRAWSAASRAALAGLSAGDLGYPDPAGHPRLRARLAEWLGRTRGVSATPDQVHVTAGVSHALWLLTTTLSASSWAVELPCSPGTTHHLLRRPVNVEYIPVDGDGLDPALIPANVGAVLVTPSHQYPTGVQLSPSRRRTLVDSCRAAGRWIVEDDYDSHLAAPGVVPAAVQALAPDLVVLTGSLSKLLAPGLRMGWIVAPPMVAARLRQQRQESDLGVSTVLQLTVAELIASGGMDQHLRRARREYDRRRELLAGRTARSGLPLEGAPVGVHAFARTRRGDSGQAALMRKMTNAGVPAVAIDDDRHSGVVISVAAAR
ncbi:PLP-dependent aminotransferase family protein [Jiangella asiatica]|uniref:PLP-dependent aminotransferase family protein n=1 Tax=Jiangella asiatica TaxID=2530372 RepID=A0A4R5CKF9_9ACTN|nr:PLP-dependent aminotransferase family protein [Jiangella asiatica]TDE00346.1 PLP-dependent aminotransferase family protein [Jiangella asiatica]